MVFPIEHIKARVLDKYPYFGSAAAGLHFKESFSVEAFETDGKMLYYNPQSTDWFSDEDLFFLFAHELCHIAFNHIERSNNKDLRLWSIAADAVTNALLIKDGLKPAPGAIIMAGALDCDAEQIYFELLEKAPSDADRTEKNPQESDDASPPSSHSDSDSQTNAEQDSSASGNQNSKKSAQGNIKKNEKKDEQDGGAPQEETDDFPTEEMGSDAHSLWNKVRAKANDNENDTRDENNAADDCTDSADDDDTITDEQRRYLENKIKRKNQLAELKEDLLNQSNGAGTTTNSDIRQMNMVGESKPLMDWRRALREETCCDVDWSYKNAVIENGVVTPHLEEMQFPVTEILLDTSGSIEASLLKSFLRECKGILRSSQIKVGCFDILFYGFREIRQEKDIDEMDFKGGGGTNFNVAVNAFSRRVTNKIIFTDGDAEMPERPMDAIWIVFGPEEIRPIGGRVISITPAQLKELAAREASS